MSRRLTDGTASLCAPLLAFIPPERNAGCSIRVDHALEHEPAFMICEGFGVASVFGEFQKFAMKGNVIDLAVGVVVGAAFTGVINSLVKDIITPPFGLLVGGLDLENLFVVLKGPHLATLKASQAAGAVTMVIGYEPVTVASACETAVITIDAGAGTVNGAV